MPEGTTSSQPLWPKKAEAAAYHQKVYLPKVLQRLEEITRHPFSVFVCGPAEETNAVAKKRFDTVNSLRHDGHNAFTGEEVVEDLKGSMPTGESELPSNVYEKAAALDADLIVVFHASPGSIAESHEFLSNADIAKKTIVFLDKAFSNGYSRTGMLGVHKAQFGQLEFYESPKDLDECNVKTKVLEYARNWRLAKWMRDMGVG